jgi:hypothetical protein
MIGRAAGLRGGYDALTEIEVTSEAAASDAALSIVCRI